MTRRVHEPAPLLSADDARRVIFEHALKPRPISVALEEATGFVLAREVRADRDVPPFDRATLDGYAVRVAYAGADGRDGGSPSPGDGAELVCEYPVVARIVAGAPSKKSLAPGSAV